VTSAAGPGVAELRLSGTRAGRDRLLAVLTTSPGVEVPGQPGPRPNRYDPGDRACLPLRVRTGSQRADRLFRPGELGGPP
jgi:hypothetical protein